MINWAEPKYLYLLFLLPLIISLILLTHLMKKKTLHRQIDPALLFRLNPNRAPFCSSLKVVFFLFSFTFIVIALARPRWGEVLQMFKGRGCSVVVAVDASKSMLAEDVKPNRLERAKAELSALIDQLANNAIGIVAFAGDAYALCPLTTDAEAAKLFLDIISPELMPVPGTDFGRAIEVATPLFQNAPPGGRALILITDGEDLGTNTERAVQMARAAGIRIYPVAFVTPEGAPIPEKSEAGIFYKKNRSGEVVISRMDERKLILMAQATEGRFFRVEGFSPERLAREIDRLEKQELTGGSFSNLMERYQPFLLTGLILLFLALILPERKIRLLAPFIKWIKL